MPRNYDAMNEDNESYWRFTGPQQLDKALHTLEGLLKGIAADGEVNAKEVAAVRNWMIENQHIRNKHPFDELIDKLEEVLEDDVLEDEEIQDVLWLCSRYTSENAFFSGITSDMQRLQATLAGIASDGVITEDELRGLQGWMNDHEHLRRYWPYDEIGTLISEVLRDGVIDESEHRCLMAFFREFTAQGEHRSLGMPLNEVDVPLSGLCAICPEISFDEKLFCFTGRSQKATRKELAQKVESLGGRFHKSVLKDTDYLVIGADGNSAWAFSCYGRKVEEAIAMRKNGCPILLVHEFDFWDTVQDLE